jgi:hypothetical protein
MDTGIKERCQDGCIGNKRDRDVLGEKVALGSENDLHSRKNRDG